MAETVVSGLRSSVGTAHPIEVVEMVPSGGGIFDIHLDGELLFSKKTLHRKAEPEEVLEAIRAKLSELAGA